MMAVGKLTRRLPILLVPLMVCAWAPLAAQDDAVIEETLRELELYESDLFRLEADGAYHAPQLVEPLSRIADSYMELNRFAEAHATLDRAQQIVRIEEGLFTNSQLPFLHRKIENFVNAGDWREARKLQDHTIWFYLNKYSWPDQDMMRGLMDLSYVHMRGITEDLTENQGYHYLRAAFSSRVALVVAERIWPQHEQRKAGLIYEQMRITYLQASAINKGGTVGQSLRTTGGNYPIAGNAYATERIMSPERALNMHRSNGVNFLERMRQIYAGEEEREVSEALAMVKLYQADWYLLFDRRLRALQDYREAWDMLLQAGVTEEDVRRLFAKPVLLPEPTFHDSVEKALAARARAPEDAPAAFEEGVPVKIFFDDERPLAAESFSAEKLGLMESNDWQVVALFSFDLPAAENIETRQGWRRQNALGVAQNLQLMQLEDFPVNRDVEQLIQNLGRLRFRPALSEGEARAADGVISYLASADP